MRSLIVGAGEVGRALSEVLEAPLLDIHTEEDNDESFDILHIAFPYWSTEFDAREYHATGPDAVRSYRGSFVDEVRRYARIHQVAMVVIHTTVPVGTCDPLGWIHAPIRGRHPNLAEGVRAFRIPLGASSALDEEISMLAPMFRSHGVGTERYPNARSTELAKLLELAQYGVEIRMQKEAEALAKAHGVDFEDVYTRFGQNYNAGWVELDETQFIKPILSHVPGPMGGHCIEPGVRMLTSPDVPLGGPVPFYFYNVMPITASHWKGDLS